MREKEKTATGGSVAVFFPCTGVQSLTTAKARPATVCPRDYTNHIVTCGRKKSKGTGEWVWTAPARQPSDATGYRSSAFRTRRLLLPSQATAWSRWAPPAARGGLCPIPIRRGRGRLFDDRLPLRNFGCPSRCGRRADHDEDKKRRYSPSHKNPLYAVGVGYSATAPVPTKWEQARFTDTRLDPKI